MHSHRKIINLISSYLNFSLGNLLEACASFALLAIYSRIFTPSQFGIIAVLQIFTTISGVLIDGRLNTAFSIKYYQDSYKTRGMRIYFVLGYNTILFLVFLGPFFIFYFVRVGLYYSTKLSC